MTFAVGCGGGESTPTTRSSAGTSSHDAVTRPVSASASDAELARFGLLPRAEIPAEVTGQTQERNRARCSPRVLFKHVATAFETSPRYEIGDGQVQQTVLLFRSRRVAARAFALLSSTRTQRCLERYVGIEAARQSQSAVSPVTEQILNLTPYGQESTTYRMIASTNAEAVSVDVLIHRVGRSMSSVSVIWERAPEDVELQEALASKIASRLRSMLG